jgi:hypothetical protein
LNGSLVTNGLMTAWRRHGAFRFADLCNAQKRYIIKADPLYECRMNGPVTGSSNFPEQSKGMLI